MLTNKVRKTWRFRFWRWVWVAGNKLGHYGGQRVIKLVKETDDAYKQV